MIELTDSTFKDETSSGLVVVDFWAEWCGPCRMFMPTLEKLSAKYEGKVKFCKVNADDYGRLVSLNGVSSLPTLLIFKEGSVVQTLRGLQPEKKMSEVLDGLLKEGE